MRMRSFLFKIIMLILLFQQYGCEDKFDSHYNGSRTNIEELHSNLLDTMKNMPEISEFYDAVMGIEIDTMISDNYIYTVLAPENEYFDLSSIPEELRSDFLLMHFTLGENTTKLLENTRLKMFSEKFLNFEYIEGNIKIDNYANVLVPDIRVTNGVIHNIDTTLIYKLNVYEYLNQNFPFLKDHFETKIIQVFDKKSSIPTGKFTPDGQTVYDTVWVDVNTFLNDVADLTNESSQYTVIIPTEEIIREVIEQDVAEYFDGIENVPEIIYSRMLDNIIINSVFNNSYLFDELPEQLLSIGYQPIDIDKSVIIEKDIELSNGILHVTSDFSLDQSAFLKTISILFKNYLIEDREDGSLDFYVENFMGVEGDNRHWDVSDHSEEATAANVLLVNQNGIVSWKNQFYEDDWIEFEIPNVLKTTYDVFFNAKGTYYRPMYRVQFRAEDGTWEDESFDILSNNYKKPGKIMGRITFDSFGSKTVRFTSIPGGKARKITTSLFELRLIPVTD